MCQNVSFYSFSVTDFLSILLVSQCIDLNLRVSILNLKYYSPKYKIMGFYFYRMGNLY